VYNVKYVTRYETWCNHTPYSLFIGPFRAN
jgi:hypothetical protein